MRCVAFALICGNGRASPTPYLEAQELCVPKRMSTMSLEFLEINYEEYNHGPRNTSLDVRGAPAHYFVASHVFAPLVVDHD